MAFDEGRVFYAYQGLENGNPNQPTETELSNGEALKRFKEFIAHAQPGDARYTYHYRDQLYHNKTKLIVDLVHVRDWNGHIADMLETKPTEYLPLFEQAAAEVLKEHYANTEGGNDQDIQSVQVMLQSSTPLVQSRTRSIRDLAAERVSQLVMITGIITSAAKPKHKATHISVQCRTCKNVQVLSCQPGLGGAIIPASCNQPRLPGEEKCEVDPFTVLPERGAYVDMQQFKLQEKPEDVPTGELPRHVLIIADRQLCNRFTPGTRVSVVGIYSTIKSKEKNASALLQPYLRAVSMIEEAGDSHSRFNFTQDEIQAFENFAKLDQIHNLIFSQIAPNIFGADDIKKAVAALLFGGSRKSLPDGTSRRGDINVLLLGDPSTAKSQFLKFASKVAPISVYTSGKGSSAAGLTATVIQDANTREFYLEGGAMVLADNGVVCIDEFDKMRPEDRVAIHEAMEQQTISIAKAGITTMLKSRTSVLAAANPPSGRYDDLKTAQDNIDLQTTILSRFDLIFIVKDPADPERDKMIARKVLDNHRSAGASTQLTEQQKESAREVEFLKRYIHYCRSQCFPRLSETAQERLAAFYVEIRGEARTSATREDTDSPPVPVTVRQLEAIIRISESFAKMTLLPTATLEHVEMAIQLFTKATMDAVKSGVTQYNIASDPQRERIHRLEDKIKRRVGVGSYITHKRLMEEMVALGESEMFVMRALLAMSASGEIEFKRERTIIHRIR